MQYDKKFNVRVGGFNWRKRFLSVIWGARFWGISSNWILYTFNTEQTM